MLTHKDVLSSIYELQISRRPIRMPLRYARDRLYVSPEAEESLVEGSPYKDIVIVGHDLTGLEMRLESDCRP